jgi:hypothetical protein
MMACVVASFGSVAACDKAADDQKKVDVANDEANEKIAVATRAADAKVAAANASFMKLREDYRHTTTTNLVDLDHDIAVLAAKAAQLPARAKQDMDARLVDIRAGRAAFMRDYGSLDTAIGAAWDVTRARLDAEWSDLKALVSKA